MIIIKREAEHNNKKLLVWRRKAKKLRKMLQKRNILSAKFMTMLSTIHTPVQFTFKPVEERTVAELLSNVNKRKSNGCDGISARALKLAGTTLAPSLCGLFNQSITSATLPREWKSANVTPVHKVFFFFYFFYL